jgi:tripartite-type tricarboxylate transporter receptor subunit TctC
MKRTKVIFFLLSLLAILSVASACSAAVDFPAKNRTITYIVGYDPGGNTDMLGRIITNHMSQERGGPVIVENLPGAANMVALNALVTRPADGYTISTCAVADSPWTYAATSPQNIRWTGDDFRVLGRLVYDVGGMGILAKKGRWKNFVEFIEEVRSKPEKTYNHGIIGPGRHDDLQIAEIEKACGVKFNIVHYGSSNAIQTDIITGDLDSGTIGCNRPNFVNNDNFEVLALYAESEPANAPVKGLPYIGAFEKDLGFKFSDFKYVPLPNGTVSVLASAKMDPEIIEIYKNCLRSVAKNESFRAEIGKLYYSEYTEEDDAIAVMKRVADAIKQAQEDAKQSGQM